MEATDHDLLIELRTEVRAISKDIKEMRDDTRVRLDALEKDVSSLKFWRGVLVGAWGVLTLVIIPFVAAVLSNSNF